MPCVSELKEQIRKYENFEVNIYENSAQIRPLNGNKFIDGPNYAIHTDDSVTVSTWESQFELLYSGFHASPLKDGGEANGHNQLKTIRSNRS